MIRVKSHYSRAAVPMRARAAEPKAERQPVPGLSERCKCGKVVRIRKDGNLVAHDYCIHALPACA